jgi:hypothetical protein
MHIQHARAIKEIRLNINQNVETKRQRGIVRMIGSGMLLLKLSLIHYGLACTNYKNHIYFAQLHVFFSCHSYCK